MTRQGGLLLIAVVAAIFLFYHFHVGGFLTVEALKVNRQALQEYQQSHQFLTAAGYIVVYILQTALSLPGAALLSMAAGAIFGTVLGTIYAVTAATIGATLAFLLSRFLLGNFVQARYGTKLEKVNRELDQRGMPYLLFLRLVPLFPFFIVNISAGLTRLPIRTFFIGTLIGIVPGGFLYVNAGTNLATIDRIEDVLSPRVLWSLGVLGLFSILPMLYRRLKQK